MEECYPKECYEVGGAKESSHGDSYQQAVLTLILLKSMKEGEFSLATEIKKWGKFDDVVLRYRRNGKSIFRAIQIKHKSKPENSRITLSTLTSNNDQFGLPMFFNSFLEIFSKLNEGEEVEDLILFANVWMKEKDAIKLDGMELTMKDSFAFKMDSEGRKLTDLLLQTQLIGFKRDSEARNIWMRFFMSKATKFDGNIETATEIFLEKFFFALSQPCEEKFKSDIMSELKSNGIRNIEVAYNSLYLHIQRWIKGKEGYFLKNEYAQKMIEHLRVAEGRFDFLIDKPVLNFSGRNDQLKHLEDIHKCNVDMVVISGLGGIGKSQLVRKFIERNQEAFDAFVWFYSETKSSFLECIHKLAFEKLGIQRKDCNGESKKTTSILEELNDILSKGKTLVIYDNVPHSNVEYWKGFSFEDMKNKLSGAYFSIVTSRSKSWDDIEVLDLNKWSIEEALEFITESLRDIVKHEEEVSELNDKLDGYPLPMQIAISFIKKKSRIAMKFNEMYGIKEYIADFVKDPGNLIDQNAPKFKYDNYSNSIRRSLQMTLDYLKRNKNGHLIQKIMNIISYLSPDGISFEEIMTCFEEESQEDIRSSLLSLDELSMIHFDRGLIKVHRIVQLMCNVLLQECRREKEILDLLLKNSAKLKTANKICLWQNASKHDNLMRKHKNILVEINDKIIEETKFEEGYPFSKYAANRLRQLLVEDNETLNRTILLITSFALLNGLCKETEESLRHLYKEQSRDIEEEEKKVIRVAKKRYGETSFEMGEYERCLKIYQEVNEVQKRVFGENDYFIIFTKEIIGDTLLKMDRTEESIIVLEECYEEMKSKQGKDHPKTLSTKYKIGVALYKMCKYKECLTLLWECYEGEKSVLGEGHPNTLMTKCKIGEALLEDGQLEESLQVFRECCEGQKRNIGEDDLNALNTKYNIVVTLLKMGQVEESLQVLEERYEREKSTFGKPNPNTLTAKYKIGHALLQNDQVEESLEVFMECYKIQKMMNGEDHPYVLDIKYIIGMVLFKIGKMEECIKMLSGCYEGKKSFLGENDTDTLMTKCKMGEALLENGQVEEALEVLKECYEVQKKIIGENDPVTLNTKYKIGVALFKMNKYEKSLILLRECYEEEIVMLGLDHSDTLMTKYKIGETLLENGQVEESLEVLKECYEEQKRNIGEDDPNTVNTRIKVGEALLENGQVEEGLGVLKESFKVQKLIAGEKDPNTLNTKYKIGKALWKNGQVEESLEVLKECYELQKICEGEDYLDAVNTKYLIGMALFLMEKLEESLLVFRECFQKMKICIGENHPDAISAQYMIGMVLFKVGNMEESLQVYRKCYEVQSNNFGDVHPDTLLTKLRIGETLMELGKLEESLVVLKDCYEGQKMITGEDKPDMLNTKCRIGEVLLKSGKFRESANIFLDVYEQWTLSLGEENPFTLHAAYCLLQSSFEFGNVNDHKELACEIYPLFVKVFGVDDSRTQDVKKWTARQKKNASILQHYCTIL